MLELAVTVSLLLSLILYALTGGADFGGGIWDFLAVGPRAERQRRAIAAAIAPIWEANHVWLILIVVVLFTGFPVGFATMMTALNIPVTLMLIGIVLRGSAFIFGSYKSQSADVQRHWSMAFGIASVFTPFLQGVILGALATGKIHVANDQVTTGFFSGWLTLFAIACGVFALGLFAFLAATYLTLDAKDQPDLQNDFRLRAIWSALALWPISGVVFLAARQGAAALFGGLASWWAPLLLGATCVTAVSALMALWWRQFAMARVAAAGQVTLIFVGWSLAQYPNLITPDVTVSSTHAPEATLRLLVMALAVGALILFPSLGFLFRLFKGNRRG
jgi:cytochrome d ubiquinol oxidase subunit II